MARPSTAPRIGAAVSPVAWMLVQRNRAVSRPSRPTAMVAVTARAIGPRATARVDLAVQLALQGAGGRLHPEDHPGDEADGDDRHEPAEGLLGLEGHACDEP